ncbi:putative fatty acyl-CoA reductase CG5065 [Neodiprion lecontei]|uniref:Fatty acyl-CoA reductase n=1 Tax=Neodiprion lecontei TaxID=441921 RepID=A0A6J0C720_NEOLC|nr:putative fatty acyl-CoA reductase CG5065 [Neodiprion lecontei]
MIREPSIPEWSKNRGILVTGATGFLGKVLVAKLLMSCPQGGNIYLLVREKRGQIPKARLHTLIQQEPYRVVRENHPERLKRLVVISGDTTVEGLALSPEDKDRLMKDVSVVFHMAANVRFDLSLRAAINMNTKGTANLIKVAKQLPNLISLIHVSTAYCHCGQTRLEERAYAPNMSPEFAIAAVDSMSDDLLKPVECKLLAHQPNTYALSKCLSEDLMVRSGLPVGIARPSIVIASWKEPAPGWVDNLNGPTGLIVAAGKGVIRSMHCKSEYLADLMPCDIVANAVIALAWKVGLESSCKPIFVNVTESGRNPITWADALNAGRRHALSNPFSGPLWYPGGRFTSSAVLHWFAVICLHLLPAYLLDPLIYLSGNKPFLVKLQGRVSTGLSLLQYYTTKEWVFLNDTLRDLQDQLSSEDRAIFFMDTKDICWDDYLYEYILGIRKYCLKDDPSTLPRARRVFQYLYIADRILRIVFVGFIAWFLYSWFAPARAGTASIIEMQDS